MNDDDVDEHEARPPRPPSKMIVKWKFCIFEVADDRAIMKNLPRYSVYIIMSATDGE